MKNSCSVTPWTGSSGLIIWKPLFASIDPVAAYLDLAWGHISWLSNPRNLDLDLECGGKIPSWITHRPLPTYHQDQNSGRTDGQRVQFFKVNVWKCDSCPFKRCCFMAVSCLLASTVSWHHFKTASKVNRWVVSFHLFEAVRRQSMLIQSNSYGDLIAIKWVTNYFIWWLDQFFHMMARKQH